MTTGKGLNLTKNGIGFKEISSWSQGLYSQFCRNRNHGKQDQREKDQGEMGRHTEGALIVVFVGKNG